VSQCRMLVQLLWTGVEKHENNCLLPIEIRYWITCASK